MPSATAAAEGGPDPEEAQRYDDKRRHEMDAGPFLESSYETPAGLG